MQELAAPGQYRRAIYTYDYLDRKLSETIKDSLGTKFTEKSWRYDAVGNCTHEITHDNDCESCIETVFDSDKRPVKVIQPDGAVTSYEYNDYFINELGQMVASTKEIDPQGTQLISIMNAKGQCVRQEKRDPFGMLLQRCVNYYDGEGNLLSRTNDVIAEGRKTKQFTTQFRYDSRNREIAIIEAAGEPVEKLTSKEYNQSGQLMKVVKPNGVSVHFTYDLLNRLTELSSSDNSVHYIYGYDKRDNIVKVEDLVHGMSDVRVFDADNHLVSEKLGTNLRFDYSYDSRDRVTSFMLPDGSQVIYTYDAVNLCTVERRRHGKRLFACNYQFRRSGKLASATLVDGENRTVDTITYGYDKQLRVREIKSQHGCQVIPEGGYDSVGNVVAVHCHDNAGEMASAYTYDGLYHIARETGVADHSYSFDSTHNRLSKDGVVNRVNALNQLLQYGEQHYDYDPNGNCSQSSSADGTASYEYDALDRLITVTDKECKVHYIYDSFHRRLKKEIYAYIDGEWRKTGEQAFLFQGNKEVGSCDAKGRIEAIRTLGLGITGEVGAAVHIEKQGKGYSLLHDFRGNVTGLIDMALGQLVESYRYSAYGEELIFDKMGIRKQEAISPWRFSSKRIDPETRWVYFGRRYYDAEVGKWTTPDPLGFQDGPNLYCFVGNCPLIYIDPDGRFLSSINSFLRENSDDLAAAFMKSCMKAYGGAEYEDCDPQYDRRCVIGRCGTPANDGVGVIFENGIANSYNDAMASAEYLSGILGGREVILIYNASHGILFDGCECVAGIFGLETRPVGLTRETWQTCFDQSYKHLVHVGHSEAMIHTRNALSDFPEDLQKQISVIGVAPGAFVSDDRLASGMHYVSRGDFVYLFDAFINGISNAAPIMSLKPHPDAPSFDHSFNSPTYRDRLINEVTTNIELYGGIND